MLYRNEESPLVTPRTPLGALNPNALDATTDATLTGLDPDITKWLSAWLEDKYGDGWKATIQETKMRQAANGRGKVVGGKTTWNHGASLNVFIWQKTVFLGGPVENTASATKQCAAAAPASPPVTCSRMSMSASATRSAC